ncbi:MORC family CW-type zinc finger protein 3-like isoform X2 [Littorina saxatilis]|uniref:MORC family CW-type zinc finger protein 3-like isoform X2 n=1 Tax=Littorina saxatilis TaxID=31220 RepID=UPI0038B60161
MDHSLVAILDVSPYNDEDALKAELWTLKREGQHRGTKIVLFNLKRNKAGQYELDFASDQDDIRNPETHESEQTSSQEQDTGFKFRQSLRAYCSILYLAPKLTIFIRGKKVKTQSLKGTLKSPEKYSYKPKQSGKGTDITFGYRRRGAEDMLEDYGIMFYHRNRLIEPYVKLKSQPPTSSSHECEVSGVIDVGEVLEPTHTKQEFQKNTTQYRSMMRALDEKLKEYLGRTSQSDEEEEEWLTCCRCGKNRKLTQSDASKFRENFCCRLNPDMSKNRCDIPEEPSADADRPTAGNRPERQGQGNRRGRSRGNTSEESTARRSTAESVDEDEQGPSSTSGVTTPSTSTATKRKSATPSRPPSSKRPRTATRSPSLEPAVAEPTTEPDAQVSPSQPQPRIIPVREHTRTIGATGPEEQSLERVVARATKQIAKSVFKNTARPRSSPSSESNTAASTSRSGNATVEGTHSGATASTSQAAGNIGNAAASTSRSGNATVEGTHSGATASTSQAAGNIGNVAASTSRSGNATVEGTHSGATASASQAAGNSSDTASSSTSSGATSSSNPQAATSNTNSTSGINRSATESANSSNVCNTGDSAGHEQAQRQLRKFKESVFKLLGLIIPYVNLGDLPGQGSEEEIETTVENMIKYIERQQN